MCKIAKYAILCLALANSSCITRQEIRAQVWLTNAPLPEDLCRSVPQLNDYGFYRRLSTGGLEFISFCKPSARRMISMIDSEFEKVLNALLPEEK